MLQVKLHQTLLINHPTTPDTMSCYLQIELLKDQFAEIYKEARKLDQFLTNKSCRRIIIAPLFGDIPTSSYSFKSKDFLLRGNKKVTAIYVLFYNVQNKIVEVIYCGKKDINLDIEKLTCQKCDNTIDNTQVIFTRQTMQNATRYFVYYNRNA